MREAYELGWVTTSLHCKSQSFEVFEIDKVVFVTPITVGSIVQFIARVVYV